MGLKTLFKRALSLLLTLALCTGVPAAFTASAEGKFKFTDVKPGDWYYSYVKDLCEAGLISGMTETTFVPDGTLTCGQALKLITLAVGEAEPAKSGSHWASGYLTLAKSKGWLAEDVDPDDSITRLAFCKIAAKAAKLSRQPEKNPFTDTNDPDVLALGKAGIINGMTATQFRPDNSLTRAQISKIIWELREKKGSGTMASSFKAEILSAPQTILSNRNSKHNYFAWPTVVRTKNGRLMVGASGFRLRHVCPFGKCAVAFSDDEGKHWTAPTVAMDSPLDDRDVGLCPFGESGIVLTSFTNSRATQRKRLTDGEDKEYILAYLDRITDEDEKTYLGYLSAVSYDNGNTFGDPFKAPVSSPHGPLVLRDNTLLWVGTKIENGVKSIAAYTSDWKGGGQTYLSTIPATAPGNRDCEPHAVLLPNGRILCHFRAENAETKLFTVFQTVSDDGGKTWTKPKQLLGDTGGAPPHLLCTGDGKIISVYAKRVKPQKILAMVSLDEGKTWQTDLELADCPSSDCGYPATVELRDGSFLTVYYAHDGADTPAVIKQVIWKLTET